MQNHSQGWWAYLSPDNVLWDVWPDGIAPIKSPQPFIPREQMPLCYEVDDSRCTQSQLEILAANFYEHWRPEYESFEAVLAYIKAGFPLACTYFLGTISHHPVKSDRPE